MANPLTDEELDNIGRENDPIYQAERTAKMTPDEALYESVQRNPDGALTDAQRAAALIPSEEMQKRREAARNAKTPETPATTTLNHTIGSDGKSRTTYGGKVRVVDQQTGAVTWEDTNGNAIAVPDSEVMRSRLGGTPVDAVQGGSAWDAALKRQNDQKMSKSLGIAQQKVGQNNELLATRRQRKTMQNLKVADNIQMATANLQANMDDVQKHIANGGGIEDSGAYLSKDGNYYVRGIVAPTMIDQFNKDMAGLGSKDALQRIVVSQKVNKTTGKPEGEPTYSAIYMKDGIGGKGSGRYPKTLSLSEALRHVEKAYIDNGMSKDQVAGQLAGVFGAENASKYGYAPKPNDGLSTQEKVQMLRNENAERDRQNKLNIAKMTVEQRKEAAEAANALKKLGIDVNIDLAEASAAEKTGNMMGSATSGVTNQQTFTEDQRQAEKDKAEKARAAARAKVLGGQPPKDDGGQSQAQPSNDYNVIDVSAIKDKAELRSSLSAAPDGSVVTLGGVTKVKRNGEWKVLNKE